MENAGQLKDTVIIYTSDHGEMAGEHGVWWKHGWYEACTRVPLIISLPEQRYGSMPAKVRRTPVGLVDLFPTICSIAGAYCPPNLAGIDLSGSILSEGEPSDRPIFCDNLVPRWGEGTEFRMIRGGRYKYVHFRNAPPLMFDLQDDPKELMNIYLNTPGYAEQAKKNLVAIAEKSMDFEEAQKERLVRDSNLKDLYCLDVPESTGNLYFMNSGKVVNAEDNLCNPTVIMEDGFRDLLGRPTGSFPSVP
jgi:choline-sulfatase